MRLKINNGDIVKFPYTTDDLRKENPSTSFPRILSDELLVKYGVFSVTEESKPETDRFSYSVKRSLPELVNNQWVIKWDIVQKTDEELAEEYKNQADRIRDSRNGKLQATDWTQITDAPVDKAAWITYRQALRDITEQAGFPWEVTWPTNP